MFRPLVRKKQELSENECKKILKTQLRGVLSVIGDNGYPYTMPMNHYYDEKENRIYFHSGKSGHRTDALKACNKVSFCVIDDGKKTENDWAIKFKSVIVFGHVEFVSDEEEVKNISKLLSYKFTDDENYIKDEIKNYIKNTDVFYINIEHMTGKTVKES